MTIKQLVEEVTTPAFNRIVALFPESLQSEALALRDNVVDMQTRKGGDYSGTKNTLQNLLNSSSVGVSPPRAVLVRIMDKVSRLDNLIDGKTMQVKDEKLQDTAIDALTYSVLLLGLLVHFEIKDPILLHATDQMITDAIYLNLSMNRDTLDTFERTVCAVSQLLIDNV